MYDKTETPTKPTYYEKSTPPKTEKEKLQLIFETVKKYKEKIKISLPKNMNIDKFFIAVEIAIKSSPLLINCSDDSIVKSIIKCASLGLDPKPEEGHVYFSPNTKTRECTARIGYRGLIFLAYSRGIIKKFETQTVYKGEIFKHQFGTNAFLNHERHLECEEIEIGYYARIIFSDGTEQFDVMGKKECETHKNKYASKTSLAWDTNFNSMAKKTVLKRLIKSIPILSNIEKEIETENVIDNKNSDVKIKDITNSNFVVVKSEIEE